MLSDNVKAILWMLGAAGAAAGMAAIIKHVASELPIAVVVFFRMGFGTVPLLPLLLVGDWRHLVVTTRLGLHLWRAFIGALALAMLAYALRHLVLADTLALTFSRPLWMIVIALLLLGERVGWRRGLATVTGFLGVLVMVRPEGEVGFAILLALGAAIISCFVLIALKQMATTEPAWRAVFYYTTLGTLMALPFAIATWVTPTPAQFFWLFLSGLAAAANLYFMSRACALGEASVIAPIDYVQLPIAALIGFLVFSELPGLWSILGTAIIVFSTLYIAHREAVLARARRAGDRPEEAPPGAG